VIRALIATLLLASVVRAEEITFKSYGKIVSSTSFQDLAKIVKPREIKIWEPHEQKEVVFKAFAAEEVFTAVYGVDWKKAEEALFTCSDGYQPSLPVDEFTKHKGFLAFARVGSKEFSVMNPEKKEMIPVGPAYLIWENIDDASIRNQGTIPGWPYQVTTIDLIRFYDRFPHMAPPPTAGAAATRGFAQFRTRCMACHTVNGEGGGKGVELNYPSNPTEYWKADWLRRWIANPQSIRYNSDMHAFDQHLPTWKADLDDVVAYLETMAKNKFRPKDAPEPQR
jgi:mono/diheme cytochrome c family protein